MKRLFTICLAGVAFATTPAFADFQDGVNAFENGDFAAALGEWQPLAEQGNSDAQYNLGLMYENGDGVARDDTEALKWYRLSADLGDAKAQYKLGLMYNNGKGVPQDYKEAVKWYTLSVEQGDADAQNNFGFLYSNGHGVLQDYVRAHMWYNIAASNGSEKGAENRNIISGKMTPSQIEKSQDLANECLAKSYRGC